MNETKGKSNRGGEKVYSGLREDILRLNLKPGSVLDEAAIAARYSVSRTPIREAFIHLISEGLVVRDGRVALVAPLNFDNLSSIFDALLLSSRVVNSAAAKNRTEADLEKIRVQMLKFDELCPNGTGIQRQDVNLEFHMAIAEAGRNEYFSNFYERMLLTASRLHQACFSNRIDLERRSEEQKSLEQHLTETSKQHHSMFEAIRDRDSDLADHLAVEHQRLSRTRLQQAVFGHNSDAFDAFPLEAATSDRNG
ncbi:GntR family transcriptional regulator [Roseovarius sp. SK2]|jgi:DNA-binding GntR family transcriptional regulator|uniref:GntR family transcriptional regulator n=1 Tax=Roseovarius TaxID=74030 RepID=UPI000CDD5ABD|nr:MULTISPECIES: GntR family transcriptional regulator [Roseovarius]MDD9724624.1 GntR family transcriptional regulator [Roseovarius sp. SK2]